MSSLRAFNMILPFLLLGSFQAAAQIQSDYDTRPDYQIQIADIPKDACTRQQPNADAIRQAYFGDTASKNLVPDSDRAPAQCYKQITKSYTICAANSDASDVSAAQAVANNTDASQTGVNTGGTTQGNQYQLKADTFTSKIKVCQDQKKIIDDTCKPLSDDLVTARTNNDKTYHQAQNTYDQSGMTNTAAKAQIASTDATRTQLNNQIDHAASLKTAADKAMDDFATCYGSSSQANQIMADHSKLTAASAGSSQGDNSPASMPTDPNSVCTGDGCQQALSKAKGQVTSTSLKAATNIAGEVGGESLGSAAEIGASHYGQAVNVLNADPLALASDGASSSIGGIASTGARVAAGTAFTAVTMTMHSTSADPPCSMVYLNAVDANAAGNCAVSANATQSLLTQP